MTIKHGELTIIHPPLSAIGNVLSLFMNERAITEHSKMAFLFENGAIYDADNVGDYHFTFGQKHYLNNLPLFFHTSTVSYFHKVQTPEHAYAYTLDDISIFGKGLTMVPSHNNSIYGYYSEKDVLINSFGIMHIPSNPHMPRFKFAYESDHFFEKEIVYLIRRLLLRTPDKTI